MTTRPESVATRPPPLRARVAPRADHEAYAAMPVAIVAPTGRDAALIARALESAGLSPAVCARPDDVYARLDDDVGAAVIAEEALDGAGADWLADALARQPSWSDVPLIVLAAPGGTTPGGGALDPPAVERFTARGSSVTDLERPVRTATLISAVRAALRARARQYEVRDHLEARERARADAERARADAEQANRAKMLFLTMMSHELRTPLNAIAGYADLLRLGVRGPINEQQAQDLDRIRANERHLLGLINDILTFARIEAGRVEYRPAAVPVRELVEAGEALVAPLGAAKQLRLVTEPSADDLFVLADGEKARQILVNLLSNAIKFTQQGSITVRAAATPDVVHLRVSDTGCGIPPEKLEQIFEPFTQLDGSFARQQQGAGLGLSISRELARGMGGDLTAESTLGVGSTFDLQLPRAARG